jgi:hypothetical protein
MKRLRRLLLDFDQFEMTVSIREMAARTASLIFSTPKPRAL